jgi:hypothetical protein
MRFGDLILLSLAISSISMTITKSNVMAWFRSRVAVLGSWFEELFQCPYCLSHWLAALGVIVLFKGTLIQLIVAIMAVVTLSSFASLGITYFFLALDALDEGSEE